MRELHESGPAWKIWQALFWGRKRERIRKEKRGEMMEVREGSHSVLKCDGYIVAGSRDGDY